MCLSLSGSERKYIRLDKGIQRDFGNKKILPKPKLLGVPSSLKLCSECNFCRLWGGRGWERGKAEASSSALLSKKLVGREGSIENQQKFDFFCSVIMP